MSASVNRSKRGCNFTPSERKWLIELVRKYPILENKSTNAETIEKKRNGWQEVAQEYNSVALSGTRTWQQLRHAYENLKQRAKKKSAIDVVSLHLRKQSLNLEKQQYLFKTEEADDEIDTSYSFAAMYCDVAEITENDKSSCSEASKDVAEITENDKSSCSETSKDVADITENYKSSCSEAFKDVVEIKENDKSSNSEASKVTKETKQKPEGKSIKEQYYLTKLKTARLEQRVLVQRERRERLEIHLLKLKIKRFVGQKNKNNLV